MAKRTATSELNRDNWDAADEKEDPGEFAVAGTEQIAQRRIKVAKRRFCGVNGSGEEGGKPAGGSVFGNFGGFGSKSLAASAPVPSVPSVFSSAPKCGIIFPSLPPSTTSSLLSSMPSKLPELDNQLTQPLLVPGPAKQTAGAVSELRDAVKSLNASVIGWLQENFRENPYVDFEPVFEDYRKHFAELKQKHNPKEPTRNGGNGNKRPREDIQQRQTSGNGVNFNGPLKTASSKAPVIGAGLATSSFGIAQTPAVHPIDPATVSVGGTMPSLFSAQWSVIKSSSSPALAASTKPLAFGFTSSTPVTKDQVLSTASSTETPKFSFGNIAPGSTFGFSFKATEKKPDDEQKDRNDDGEEGEYEPPKAERVEQVEEDAFYSTRCKLFYKKDGKFVEKGVGTLSLKPLDGGPKVQLLIRADTTLGTILLNLALNDSIPCSRNGKTNITMVCVPNPPLDPTYTSKEPVSLIIRVKSAAEADELLEELKKAKSAS